MWWFGVRAPQSRLDERYRSLRLSRAPAGVPEEFGIDAERLRHWTSGIAIGTPAFVVAATIVRGWQDTTALQFIAVIGLLAFLWSSLLACASESTGLLRRIHLIYSANSAVLLSLTTSMMSLTGGPFSPLFGLYLLLIVGETLQDRRRGLCVAWCSLALISGLIIVETLRWWPIGWGVPWDVSPLNTNGMPYALGVAFFYFVIAIGVSAFSHWVARHERELREQHDVIAKQERTVEGERAKLQTEYQGIGQRAAQFNQERRRFEAEREQWERQRQVRDLQHAQEVQRLAEQEAAVAERARESEERSSRLRNLQQQFDEERARWEQQRTRTIKGFDDQDAELTERTREFEDAMRDFEARRAQTSASLTQLESTLLTNLKRVNEETGQADATRRALEEAQRTLAVERERWASEQARAAQDECCTKEELAQRAQALDEAAARLEASKRSWADEQQTLDQPRAEREARLAKQEADLDERQRHLATQASVLEQTRGPLEAAHSALEAKRRDIADQAHRLDAQQQLVEQEQQRFAHEMSERERTLQAQAAQLLVQQAELQMSHTQLAEQVRQLNAQRRALVQEQTELERQRHQATGAMGFSRRVFVEQVRRALQAQARRLREQGRKIAQGRRDVAVREQQSEQQRATLQRQEHEHQRAAQQFHTERDRLLQQLRKREVELAERLQHVGESQHRLDADQREVEVVRRRLETEGREHASLGQQEATRQAQELRKARQAIEAAHGTLVERQRAFEVESRQWQEMKFLAEEAMASRDHEVLAQRRALEQHQREFDQARQEWERTHSVTAERTSQQEQQLGERVRQLDARERQCATLQQQLDDQRRELERRQQDLTQASTQQDQAHADIDRQRDTLVAGRQDLQRERQALEAARQQVTEASHALADPASPTAPDRFSSEALTLLANEFNAPLAGVHTLVSSLLEGNHGEVPPAILDSLRSVAKTNDQLRRVVADALDAVRAEHGRFHVAIHKVPLDPILTRAVQELNEELTQKSLSLKREGETSLVVSTDPAHAHRILTALLRNAVQYTERGGITVTASAHPDHVAVTIADTGIGIRTGRLGQLFARPRLGTLLHGKGVGLYLARGLAKAMGGNVTFVSSELEHGSSFAVTFPRAVRASVDDVSADSTSLKQV